MALQQTAGELMPELARGQRQCLVAGGAGLLVSAIGGSSNPAQFFQSYLMAYMLCLSVTLGCLALGMLHQLSGGAWGVVIRRPIGAASRVLPVMTLLFLPIVFGMTHLYVWTDSDGRRARRGAAGQASVFECPLLSDPRGDLLRRLERDLVFPERVVARTGSEPRPAHRAEDADAQRGRPGGLRPDDHVRVVRLADVDRAALVFDDLRRADSRRARASSAMAFLIIVLAWLSRRPPLDRIVVKAHFHDLGNLTLAFVMLWAYFSFSQYLIIWAGNLPHEIAWYVNRLHTGWRAIGVTLVVFHFAVPFAAAAVADR